MKTTVEIPDHLFAEAKRFAEKENTTLKAVIEQGLRRVLAEQGEPPAFKLRDGSVGGNGLTPEFRNATWDQIRDLVYEDGG